MKIDVGAIVAKLPRPTTQVISLDARRLDAKRTERERSLTTRARGAWKLAAALGVIVAGGWSIMMVRSGGIPTMQMQADSVPLTDVASAVVTPDRGTDSGVVSTPEDSASFDQSAILTFDTLHDLSEEEVTHLLDRLEKWDGATSTETSTMRPILVTTLPEVSK